MARCEQGYRCEVCGKEVEEMVDSDLYLRYVLGEISVNLLHRSQERHIRCNPAVAQFIVDPRFEPAKCPGAFDKENLDQASVAAEETRITRAWQRLQQLPNMGISLMDYPMPESRNEATPPLPRGVSEENRGS
jgi:hypothetical protein